MKSKQIEEYFSTIEGGVDLAYDFANKARIKGYDPSDEVEISRARNVAERVVGLISIVAPGIKNVGIIERIAELEKEYEVQDWRVAYKIAEEVAQEKFCKFNSNLEAAEVGIRVGFAYLTLGTVSSPLEGLVCIKTKKKDKINFNATKDYCCSICSFFFFAILSTSLVLKLCRLANAFNFDLNALRKSS